MFAKCEERVARSDHVVDVVRFYARLTRFSVVACRVVCVRACLKGGPLGMGWRRQCPLPTVSLVSVRCSHRSQVGFTVHAALSLVGTV